MTLQSEFSQQIYIPDATEHTMASSIYKYASQKVPLKVLNEIKKGKKTLIYPLYPRHKDKVSFYSIPKDYIEFKPHAKNKKINFVRPHFYMDKESIKVFLAPGSSYLKHYWSLLGFLYKSHEQETNIELAVKDYSTKEFIEDTQVSKHVQKSTSVIVIGHVIELKKFLSKKKILPRNFIDTDYYLIYEYEIDGKIVTLLGVKYSFWGDLSGYLIKPLLHHNLKTVLYIGKLGTTQSPAKIYNQIYSPTSYILADHTSTLWKSINLVNPLVKFLPHLDTGMHLSVPTVLEQSYTHKNLHSNTNNVNSVDNEISYMAKVIEEHNQESGPQISFGCLHFATDYIRKPNEKELKTTFDLSNHRKAKKQKTVIFNQIFSIAFDFLKSTV